MLILRAFVAKPSEETNANATYIYHFMFLASMPSIRFLQKICFTNY